MGFSTPLDLRCIAGIDSLFRFKVLREFVYTCKDGEIITVPVDFKTDFASVPWFFRRLIPKSGRYNEATVVHDYLCFLWKKGKYDRKRADKIFREAMEELGVKKIKRGLMYRGVWAYSLLKPRKRKVNGC